MELPKYVYAILAAIALFILLKDWNKAMHFEW